MPKVIVALLLFLISLNVGAVGPQGFVIKGAFVQSDGSITTDYFPGDGKVIVFKSEDSCNKIRLKIEEIFEEKSPDLQYFQICVPTPKEVQKVLARPEA